MIALHTERPWVVTARVTDPDAPVVLRLKYRIDPSASYSFLTMVDDGTSGDAIAGDGIYSASIPGQTAGATVPFYLEAVDGLGATNTFPTDVFPTAPMTRVFPLDASTRECLVRWGETNMPGSFSTYHVWLTSANTARWNTRRPVLNNTPLDGTFVYGSSRVIYNVQPLFYGDPWHRGSMQTGPDGSNRVHFTMIFPDDDQFLGASAAVWNNPGATGGTSTSDTSAQAEQLSHLILREMGLPHYYQRYVHLFVNASQRSVTSNRPGNFIMEDAQRPGADFIRQWYSVDPAGELFALDYWFEFPDNGDDFSANNDADLVRRTIPGTTNINVAAARFMWRKRPMGAGQSANDYTSFVNLMNIVSPAGVANNVPLTNQLVQFGAIADYEQWMRLIAVQHALGNWDSYGYRRGKEAFAYKGQSGKFELFPGEVDFALGIGGDGTGQTIFDANPGTDGSSGGDPRIIAMWNTPAIARAYWRAFQDLLNGPWRNSFLDPILDAKAAALMNNNVNVDPATLITIKNYIAGRRSYLASQLATVASPFAVSSTNLTVNNNLVTLTGTAPIETTTILINGAAYPIIWNSVRSWTIHFLVEAGLNPLTVTSLDSSGQLLQSIALTVHYIGPVVLPEDYLVINEIMADPAVPGAQFVEIHNTSPNYTFDLYNWRLDELGYVFPPGTWITPGGFVVVARNRAVFAAAYGDAIPVVGEFSIDLNPAGGALSLTRTGPVLINELLANAAEPNIDYVELFNVSGQDVDISSCSLSDKRSVNKFVFPPGSVVPARGFLALDQSVLGFAFKTNGETVYFRGPTERLLDCMSYSKAPTNGLAAGRYPDGGFATYELGASTPAANNNPPQTFSPLPVCVADADAPALVLARVRYEGRPPWASGTNTHGASLQLIDARQDISRAGNWSDGRGWHSFSTNINIGNSLSGATNLYLFLDGAGDLYLDDISLVAQTGPTTGSNIVQNGGFESSLSGTWNATDALSNSAISTAVSHSGYACLHLVSTRSGSGALSAISVWQTVAINTNTVYTLRYWFIPTTNANILTVRLNSAARPENIVHPPAALPTPGAVNLTAATLPPFPPLWLNEVQPVNLTNIVDNFGEHEPWIELYHSGSQPLALDGFYLADNYLNLRPWPFPAGTTMQPGELMVVWADGETNESASGNLHTSFRLNGPTGSVALTDGNRALLVDYLNYTDVWGGLSYGSVPDGQAVDRAVLATPTPHALASVPVGGVNLPPLPPVFINEWMADNFTFIADPSDGQYDDWFELYNAGDTAVDLGNYYLTDTLAQPTKFRIPNNAQYVIPPRGFLLVWADREAGQNSTNRYDLHASFSLSSSGEDIGLSAPDGRRVDLVRFRLQIADRSEGRYFDGGPAIFPMTRSTPGDPNEILNTAPVLAASPARTITAGQTLSFSMAASDAESPPQRLEYLLRSGAPVGATLDAATGWFSWTPHPLQAPSTNVIGVVVTDDGIPPKGVLMSFVVQVLTPPPHIIEFRLLAPGQVSLIWQTVAGKSYRVEYKNRLSDETWTPLGGASVAPGESLTVIDQIDTNHQRFYRTVILD